MSALQTNRHMIPAHQTSLCELLHSPLGVCGGAAQFLGSQLGQILFLYYSWLGVSLCSFAALLTARHYTRKALVQDGRSAPFRAAPAPAALSETRPLLPNL